MPQPKSTRDKQEEQVENAEQVAAVARVTAPPIVPLDSEEPGGKYLVLAVGVSYAVPGTPAGSALGLQGRVIDLDDEEATRLLKLGAVRAATKDEVEVSREREARDLVIAAENAAGPAGNPFGGQIAAGTTLEEHAAEQIKLARKAAKA